jgi:tetratricopeptide (TPR) repeat protein
MSRRREKKDAKRNESGRGNDAAPVVSSSPRVVTAVAIALVVLTVFVYAAVRHHEFVNLDDAQYVSQNPEVLKGLTWSGVGWAFTGGYAGNWHPLTWVSHMLDVQWFGLDAGAHHLTNLVLHTSSVLLLFWLFLQMTGALWRSAFVAALFAVHPLRVESVAWIAERKDVLSTVLWMATLVAYVTYVRRRQAWRYACVILLFALALMAKPMVVTLPFVLLLLDVWPLGRTSVRWPGLSGPVFGGPERSALRTHGALIREKLPLFALAAASSVVTIIVQHQAGAVKTLAALPLDRRAANSIVAYGWYVTKAIWPVDLAAVYPYQASLPAWQVIGTLTGLALVTALVVRTASRRPYLLVGWFLFLGTLVPVIGLVQVGGTPTADRHSYVPSIGLFVMAAWGLPDLLGRWRIHRLVLGGAGALAVLACAVTARAQVGYWADSVTLWRHAIQVTSGNYRAHSNLGQALATRHELDAAIAEYTTALEIKPDFAEARNYLGFALAERGDYDAAIVQYREALRALPTFVEAHNNLGLALAASDHLDEAIAEFSETVRLDPRLAAARSNLGIALARVGRTDDAIRELTEALALDPDSEHGRANLSTAYRDRGQALVDAGRLDDALQAYQTAATHTPNDADVHYELGVALARRGRITDAIREVQRALQLNPAHEEAKRLLAELTKK